MLNLFTLIIFKAFIVSQSKIIFEGSKIFRIVGLANDSNKTLQLTQKAPFVLCITLRFIMAQNKGHFSGI
jgi:hypothetical protein